MSSLWTGTQLTDILLVIQLHRNTPLRPVSVIILLSKASELNHASRYFFVWQLCLSAFSAHLLISTRCALFMQKGNKFSRAHVTAGAPLCKSLTSSLRICLTDTMHGSAVFPGGVYSFTSFTMANFRAFDLAADCLIQALLHSEHQSRSHLCAVLEGQEALGLLTSVTLIRPGRSMVFQYHSDSFRPNGHRVPSCPTCHRHPQHIIYPAAIPLNCYLNRGVYPDDNAYIGQMPAKNSELQRRSRDKESVVAYMCTCGVLFRPGRLREGDEYTTEISPLSQYRRSAAAPNAKDCKGWRIFTFKLA
jgi:hypothetical protein